MDSVCIVTYEVIHYDMVINTGYGNSPIICPLKLLYKNITEHITITIENYSGITGKYRQ